MKVDYDLRPNILPFPTMPRKRDFTPTNRLRELRLAARRTLQSVADELNTTPAQVQRLELGDRELTLHWMQRFAAIYGCTPADVLLPADGGLDPRERDLVDTVREVPPQSRTAIFGVAESLQPFRAAPEVVDLVTRKSA